MLELALKLLSKIGIGKIAGKFLDNQKHRDAGIFGQEKELAKQMRGSWKDEYLTIIFSLPFIIIFIGVLIDSIFGHHPDGIGRGLIDAGNEMFSVINGMSEDYRMIMLLIVSASFGTHITRINAKRKLADTVSQIVKAKKDLMPEKTARQKQVEAILNRGKN